MTPYTPWLIKNVSIQMYSHLMGLASVRGPLILPENLLVPLFTVGEVRFLIDQRCDRLNIYQLY